MSFAENDLQVLNGNFVEGFVRISENYNINDAEPA